MQWIFYLAIILAVLSLCSTSHLVSRTEDATSTIVRSKKSRSMQLRRQPLARHNESEHERSLRGRSPSCKLRLIIALIPKTGGRDMRVKMRDALTHVRGCRQWYCANPKYCFSLGSGIMYVHIQPEDQPFRAAIWKNSWKYNFSVLTFLRDPVERVISEYYFLKAGGFMNYTHLLEERGWHNLEEYAKANRNYMTGFLLGYNMWSHVITQTESEQLLQNIRKGFKRDLLFVGILEEYVMSWRLLKRRIGHSSASQRMSQRTSNDARHINANKKKPHNISASLRRKIRDWNKMDVELYELGLSHIRNLSKSVDSVWYNTTYPKLKNGIH